MPDYCPDHSEHSRAIRHHDSRLDKHSATLDELREDQFDLRLNLQKLSDIEGKTNEILSRQDSRLDNHEERISNIEDQPARDIKRVKDYVLSAFGGALGTGLIALFVFALTKSIQL